MPIDDISQLACGRHIPMSVGYCLRGQEDNSYETDGVGDNRTFPMGGRDVIRSKLATGEFTRAGLSRVAGKSPTYIQQFLERGSPVELPEAVREALAPVLGLPADTLREGAKAQSAFADPLKFSPESDVQLAPNIAFPGSKRLPLDAKCEVMGVVEAGPDGQFIVNLATSGPLEYVDLPKSLIGVPDIFALFVAGESMAAVWMPGDIVFVSKRRPVTAGCYVVVVLEQGKGEQPSAFLKQYVWRNSEKLKLRQYNPAMDIEIDTKRVMHLWRALHWREWAT